MIYSSSKDHFTGTVLMMWDGDQPSTDEINSFCRDNYGFVPTSAIVERPYKIKGFENPGTVLAYQPLEFFKERV